MQWRDSRTAKRREALESASERGRRGRKYTYIYVRLFPKFMELAEIGRCREPVSPPQTHDDDELNTNPRGVFVLWFFFFSFFFPRASANISGEVNFKGLPHKNGEFPLCLARPARL